MFKRLKNKIKTKLNNYLNSVLDPKLNEIKDRQSSLKDETINDVSRLIKASIVNKETFGPYKDYCKGKKLVICGAGPSLSKYKPIPGAIHIALNRAFLFDKVHFDFYFSADQKGINNYKDEFIKYKDCIKLLGDFSENYIEGCHYKEELARITNAKRWFLKRIKNIENISQIHFVKNIDLEPLEDFPDVGIIVLQFALFMNPDDIYLVGYDLGNGHFNQNDRNITRDNWSKNIPIYRRESYRKFIEFKNYHYPHIKIHSINPVGLKRMFDDIYQ